MVADSSRMITRKVVEKGGDSNSKQTFQTRDTADSRNEAYNKLKTPHNAIKEFSHAELSVPKTMKFNRPGTSAGSGPNINKLQTMNRALAIEDTLRNQ